MIIRVLTCCCALSIPSLAMTQTPPAPTTPQATESQEVVYGYQLMTDAERAEYRTKMRSLKTPAERQAFRLAHHEQMQARAKEKGVTLPDMPPPGGMRQGAGGSPGAGMRQGMPRGPGGASTPASTSSSSAP